MTAVKCSDCRVEVDPLALFPGNRCIACFEGSPDDTAFTAEGLAAAFSGGFLK